MKKIKPYYSLLLLLFFYQGNAQQVDLPHITTNQVGINDADPLKIVVDPSSTGSTTITATSAANSTLQIAPTTGGAVPATGLILGGSAPTAPVLDPNKVVGTLQGTPSVGANGAANYSIPIPLPPGTHDMAPKLNLQYNSNLGEGIMGMGWSLGLSSIVRVNKNIYHDKVCQSVALDVNDALSLDGNRMYVADNSPTTNLVSTCVYRLEDETYTRITYSTTAGGVKYFLAETKQGIKMEYGSTVDSKVKLGSTDYEYFLSKVYDNFGNYISYTYNNNTTNNEVTLKEIDYTANDAANISAYNSILFYYDTRDASSYNTKFVAGNQMNKTQLLNEIDVKCGVSYIKKYNFDYGINSYHYYLDQIDITDYDGNQLNPTVFNYATPFVTSNLFSDYSADPLNSGTGLVYGNGAGAVLPLTNADLFTGDVNGDGKTDIVAFNYNSFSLDQNQNISKDFTVTPGQGFKVFYANGLNDFTPATSLNPYPSTFLATYSDLSTFYPTDYNSAANPREFSAQLRDFNGDGKADLPILSASTGNQIKVTLYKGDNTSASGFTIGNSCLMNADQKMAFGDVDGDGTVEGIIYNDDNSNIQSTNITLFNFKTGSFINNSNTNPIGVTSSITGVTNLCCNIGYTGLSAIDIDGDGAEEIYATWNGNAFFIKINKNSSGSYSADAYWEDPTPVAALINHQDFYGDFNGDGITDFTRIVQDVQLGQSNVTTGAGLHYGLGAKQGVGTSAAVVYANSDPYFITKKYFSADMNGDHKTDLVEVISRYCQGASTIGQLEIYYWDSDKPTKIQIGNLSTELSVFNYNFSPSPTTSAPDYDMDGVVGLQLFTGSSNFPGGSSGTMAMLPVFLTGDFNGDGRDDIMIKLGNSGIPGAGGCTNTSSNMFLIFSLNPEWPQYLLTTIYDGYDRKVNFSYGATSLNTSTAFNTTPAPTSFYTTSSTTPTFPVKKHDGPEWVTTKMQEPDGVNGINETDYTYQGGLMHLQGKGFLAFDQKVSTNLLVSNIKSTDTYTVNSFFERYPKSSVNVLASSPTTPVSNIDYAYPTLVPTLSGGGVQTANCHYSYLQTKTTTDKVTGFITKNAYVYSPDGNVTSSTTTYAASVAPANIIESTVVSTNSYNAPNLTTHDTWIQTWPLDVTSTTQRGIVTSTNPVYTRKLNYTYTPQGEKLTEVLDQGSTGYVENDYVYDPNTGVLTQKTTTAPTGSSSGGALPQKVYSYVYDNINRFVRQTTNPLNQVSYSGFDERFGSLTYTKDITNLETYYTYDGEGRLIKKVTPDNITTTITYNWVPTGGVNSSGEPISNYGQYILHSSNAITTGKPTVLTYYDMFDREINTRIDGYVKPICKAKIYDAFGHVLEETGPYYRGTGNLLKGLVTTNTFDQFQRAHTCTTTYAGLTTPNITLYAYAIDGNGNYQTTTTMPDLTTKSTFIDPSNLLVKTTDGVGTIVNYNYLSNRKIGTTTLGSGAIITEQMIYDAYARLYQLIEPNSGTTTYFYNAYGLLESTLDARNVIVQNTYDVLDRITSKVSPDGTFAFQYVQSGNGLNLLQTETSPGVSYGYVYDNLNRLKQKTDIIIGNQYNTNFEYDLYNNITKITYPGGFAITQEYDLNNSSTTSYLTKIKRADTGDPIWQAVDMTPFVQYNQYKLGNNAATVVTYNNFGMPMQYNSGSIFNYGLTPDIRNGNITNRTNLNITGGLTEGFTYDNENRLLTSTINNNNNVTTVVYDAAGNGYGNISSKTANNANGSNLGIYAYQSGKINQLNTVENIDLSISANKQDATYNSFSKLSTLTEDASLYTYALTYGPDMQRVQSLLTNVTTGKQYKRDYVPSYEKTTGPNNFSREISYINAPYGLCAMYVKNGTNDSLYLVYSDHLGSILKLTDANGVTIGEQSFDAWGRYRNINDWSYATPQIMDGLSYRGFTGHEHLPQFDLINMNGRVYDSKLGLFLSVDPLLDKTPGVSPYHYAKNNPLKFTDPTGTTGQSTHTDDQGKVVAVFDDGDMGVYQHTKDVENELKEYSKKNTAAGGKLRGYTEHWDEFALHNSKGAILSSDIKGINFANPNAKIKFGHSIDNLVQVFHDYAKVEMDYNPRAPFWLKDNSGNGKTLDIKTKIGEATGYLLNGYYVTGESAGNYLFGENLRYSIPNAYSNNQEYGSYWNDAAKRFGAYHNAQNKVNNPTVPPYYGEIPYSGRQIASGYWKRGFNSFVNQYPNGLYGPKK